MAQLSQLLLFDPDPSGLDTLTYGFEKNGCSVTGTGDAIKARDLILGATPPLVVVNLRESEQVGLDLLRATTSNPRTRNLACVAMGREELRSAALAAGAFVFLSVPLFLRDVLGACRLVAAASIPGSRPSPDAELAMKLTDLDSVYFLVRTLAVTGRSAVVDLRHDTKRGELRFIDGTLCSAQLGSVEGFPALHHMLLWEDGLLGFKFKNVVRRGTQLSIKSSEVIEECDRFLRDFAHEARELGTARTIYIPDLERIQPSAALPSEVVPVLRLFDGRRDLREVLDDSPFRVFDTLKIAKRFVADEAIKPSAPLPQPTRDLGAGILGPSALDYWLQKQAPILGPEVGRRPVGSFPAAANVGTAETNLRARPLPSVVSPPTVIVSMGEDAVPERQTEPEPQDRIVTGRGLPTAARLPPASEDGSPSPVPRSIDGTPKGSGAVARGEIQVAPTPLRETAAVPVAGAPSVLVDIEPPPAAEPPVVVAAPAAEVVDPVAEAALLSKTPVLEAVAPLPHPGLPSVIVAPMTPLPVPVAANAHNHAPTAEVATEQKRNSRPPSDNFSPVESDFFEREADLYKRESVESFEDLDAASRAGRAPNGQVRKR